MGPKIKGPTIRTPQFTTYTPPQKRFSIRIYAKPEGTSFLVWLSLNLMYFLIEAMNPKLNNLSVPLYRCDGHINLCTTGKVKAFFIWSFCLKLLLYSSSTSARPLSRPLPRPTPPPPTSVCWLKAFFTRSNWEGSRRVEASNCCSWRVRAVNPTGLPRGLVTGGFCTSSNELMTTATARSVKGDGEDAVAVEVADRGYR